MYGIPHRVAHDLESLFYVLLFICTHLGGPRNSVGNLPSMVELLAANTLRLSSNGSA